MNAMVVGEFINRQFDRLDQRIDETRAELGGVKGRLDKVETRLDRIETKVELMDDRLWNVEMKVERIDERLGSTATKTDVLQLRTDMCQALNRQTWSLVTVVSGFGSILAGTVFYIARYVH